MVLAMHWQFLLLCFLQTPASTSSQPFSSVLRHQIDRVPSGTLFNSLFPANKNGATQMQGELSDTSDKLIQRITSMGTSYYLMDNGNGRPLYRRKEIDTNRDYVVFPDPNYTPGDGHYVVLRKLYVHNTFSSLREPIYQGFYLVLGDSVHAFMAPYKPSPTGNPRQTQFQELQRQRMHQPTYNVELTEAGDVGDMIQKAEAVLPD